VGSDLSFIKYTKGQLSKTTGIQNSAGRSLLSIADLKKPATKKTEKLQAKEAK
jgi:hypothetical protein